MSNVTQQVNNLKTTLFGADEPAVKAYSVRLPLDLTAYIEAITTVSGKSRNIVIADVLRLGVTCLIDNLDGEQLVSIKEAYELEKIELHVESMGGK